MQNMNYRPENWENNIDIHVMNNSYGISFRFEPYLIPASVYQLAFFHDCSEKDAREFGRIGRMPDDGRNREELFDRLMMSS
jgi:hypothetical protein